MQLQKTLQKKKGNNLASVDKFIEKCRIPAWLNLEGEFQENN